MDLQLFLAVFVPLFVAVDAIGILPIFISVTSGLGKEERGRILRDSLLTASAFTLTFIFVGRWIFRHLGITQGDFMIAGGVILFCIAILDILSSDKKRRRPQGQIGIVPLGTPLIAGPALLTTSLMILDSHGPWLTVAGVLLNLTLAGLVFYYSSAVIKLIGVNGARALSKIAALFLAAIAVMMIRKGLAEILLVTGS